MKIKNVIAGNWKMNQTLEQINAFFAELEKERAVISNAEAWIAPQAIHFSYVQSKAALFGIKVGVQNCSDHEKGAFTGEVSPVSLKDMGCNFVIIGHSERRSLYGETDAFLNKKLHLAIKTGLKVIFCCGETLEERERGQAETVVKQQLKEGLKGLSKDQTKLLLIAYEPVWAIGTGKTASPKEAQDMHAFARKMLIDELALPGNEIPILYGGSVNPANIAELLDQNDINGGLVGGASLKANDYIALCSKS